MTGLFDDALAGGWIVPLGWQAHPQDPPAQCRSCHAEVLWATTPAGKRAPLDRDGKSHFSSCPQANDWRKRA